MDFFVQDMAFLWITNASDRTYLLPMTGGTNTGRLDAPIGLGGYQQQSSGSYLVNCEFSGEPTRPVNPMQWGQCLTLAPHSAFRVRVPLPPEGAKRRVAVLVCEPPSGPRRFWTNSIGLRILRTLPRSAAHKVLWRQPAVLRVWCDRELSQPGEGHKEMIRRTPPNPYQARAVKEAKNRCSSLPWSFGGSGVWS